MYLTYFGFKEAPFSLTPDPRFLFFARHHREAYDHHIYGIENRKGFIELTGEVGSGKTTICRTVLSGLSANVNTALVLNPRLTETQLLKAILSDFTVPVSGRSRLAYIECLNAFLLNQLRLGNNVALIIDEAQDLSEVVLEQVRLLSNLETDQHKLIQIVLCGQPELRHRLALPSLRQLRQRIMVRYHLFPLTEHETKHYIQFRLKKAGLQENELFSLDAMRRVYRYSNGIPRLINAVCDIALLAGYAAGTKRIDSNCIKKAIRQLEGRV